MFLAKISKGRTIKEYLLGTILAPSMYCFVWIILYGGVALRLERESSGIGLCCKDTSGWFHNTSALSNLISQQNLQFEPIDATSSSWMCDGECGSCAKTVISKREESNQTYGDVLNEYMRFGNDIGSVTSDRSLSRLSCHSIEQMWFDVIRSYTGIGEFLSAFSLISIVLYFVTSSDSGSLVIDCLSANGSPEPPAIQRVFWALMEGATATALLVAGGKNSLTAIQTIGIVSALPYSVIILLICVSLFKALKVAKGSSNPKGPGFECGLFDPLAGQPFKTMKMERVVKLFGKFIFNIPFAPLTVTKVGSKIYNIRKRHVYCLSTMFLFGLFIMSIVLCVLEFVISGMWAIGLFVYLCFCACMAVVRGKIRDRLRIEGSIIEDFLVSVILYPSVAVQLEVTMDNLCSKEENSITSL